MQISRRQFFKVGWPADGVLFAAVSSLNGLKNQSSTIHGTAPPDPDFLRALEAIDLVVDAIPALLKEGVQLAILGSGAQHFEHQVRVLAARYPQQIGLHIGYDEPLAHLIEAGADLFLMPSRFEPCGLNQIYSLRYGTLPVVRRTGGLADTVVDTGPTTLSTGRATGFVFDTTTSETLLTTVRRALVYFRQPKLWRQLIANAMSQDFSWHASAHHYLTLYRQAIREHTRPEE